MSDSTPTRTRAPEPDARRRTRSALRGRSPASGSTGGRAAGAVPGGGHGARHRGGHHRAHRHRRPAAVGSRSRRRPRRDAGTDAGTPTSRCSCGLGRLAAGVLGDADPGGPADPGRAVGGDRFRAGLFNIGAEGQMLVGGMLAAIVGFTFDLPAGASTCRWRSSPGPIGGPIWGGIPGLLRAKTGAHEVITTIMLNYIALRAGRLLPQDRRSSRRRAATDPISKDIRPRPLPALLGFLDRLRPAGPPRDHRGAARRLRRVLAALQVAPSATSSAPSGSTPTAPTTPG